MTAKIIIFPGASPLPKCPVCRGKGLITAYSGRVRIETKCLHCKGAGRLWKH
jgi:DnaJ-class molecular chaperone